ncbi:GTP-binding protein [Cellulophaga sp. E16_2]|uniref:Small GTP-binding protein n=1 Tax=Cellulophaga algicola (strain DSM 14237 / IC166 / ACAM 630) TaxID=688270 RepID=E6X8R9_CELAD|nr:MULTISPECIES: Rab family GTPase [Cellulophaga]ADV48664.1 small GTP-binding protein [Cellulophaga algicola DSM 14237]MBO0591118.1 GTP-binding protein [Cellulophaga sp. E16_2]
MQVSKKIVVLGHFGVGKTSLIRRFVEDSFSDNYKVSIGVHITKKVVEITPEEKVSLILWDLEGTDDLTTIRDAYLLGTHGVVFVFDVTRPSTFQALNSDLDIVKTKIASIPLLVVGNKVDLVLKEDLEKLFKNNNIETNFLTSAKTGDTVNDLFLHLAKLLH